MLPSDVRSMIGISRTTWKKAGPAARIRWTKEAMKKKEELCVEKHDMFPEPEYYETWKEETMNTVEVIQMQWHPDSIQQILGHALKRGPVPCCGIAQEEEKVNAMDTNTETTNQRRYLRNRLDDMAYAKKNDLKKAFGLVEDTPPKDAAEVVKRIQDGKFSLDEKVIESFKNEYGYVPHIFTGLKWQDPSVTPDKAGYDAAKEKMKADVVATTDIIAIKSPEDGLAALQEFEAKTYH